MFGDTEMLGQTEQTVDNRTRVFIPKTTNREEGENLVVISDAELGIFKIYKQEVVSKIFDKLNKELFEAKTEDEIKKCNELIYNFSKTILNSSAVDKQGRIVLGESFKGISKVNIIGVRDHLILELKK